MQNKKIWLDQDSDYSSLDNNLRPSSLNKCDLTRGDSAVTGLVTVIRSWHHHTRTKMFDRRSNRYVKDQTQDGQPPRYADTWSTPYFSLTLAGKKSKRTSTRLKAKIEKASANKQRKERKLAKKVSFEPTSLGLKELAMLIFFL